MRWVTGLGIGACAVAALTTACSGDSESSSKAEPTLVPAFTQPAPGDTPAPTVPTTTIAVTTTTLDMRSVEVPPGAPPLPLYSGDPVLMTEALFEFWCWIDQHPLDAGQVAHLYGAPDSDFLEAQTAELDRVIDAGGLVLTDCADLIEVRPVATSAPEMSAMALAISSRPFAEEVSPSGTRSPLPTWNRAETLLSWQRQADGRWLVVSTELRSKS